VWAHLLPLLFVVDFVDQLNYGFKIE